jgi:hypothetical protein
MARKHLERKKEKKYHWMHFFRSVVFSFFVNQLCENTALWKSNEGHYQ